MDGKVGRRIHEAEATLSTILDLHSCELKAIPESIFELSQLEELILSSNQITAVPGRISQLTKLRRLDLTRNPLLSVPNTPGLLMDWDAYLRTGISPENVSGIDVSTGDWEDDEIQVLDGSRLLAELTGMPQLRQLAIGSKAVTQKAALRQPPKPVADLIDSLWQFRGLESLSIFGILLGRVPSSLRYLDNLQSLGLSATGLHELPEWFGEFGKLENLALSLNSITDLPSKLKSLELTHLGLSSNEFECVPDVIFKIRSLIELRLDHNRIKRITSGILNLSKLSRLDIGGNPIESPPPEITNGGVSAIKNYWRQKREAGIDYLCEAKLLIIGEPGAGKTSLAKKIKSRAYQLRTEESSTEGIEISHWQFPAAIRIKEEDGLRLLERAFQVNLWDFGGQEIYHATHQFFLTRRSVYALVVDDRKEDTDFNYWLQLIELLGGGSPLLIVQNEKQDRRRDVDLSELRARFTNLRDTYRVNLANNRGLDELTRALERELEHLPHIGVALPATWRRVRGALEKDPRNFIGLGEYLAICQKEGFVRLEDKLQLSGYLHDLGICLHFQDDPVLKNIVILRPKWGTDAVYRVLDDEVVLNRRGRFSHDDLGRIWSEEEYSAMQHELLRLMMKFQLCYELPSGNNFIAPQLLSPVKPAYSWRPQDNLILRYSYEFMPKGLVTRLIVALHHLISEQKLVWKNGVLLERNGTRAEVTEDYSRRKILVRAVGRDTRGLLAIVNDQLHRIHERFNRLKFEVHLACNCASCSSSSEPYMFSLVALRQAHQAGCRIQCHNSFKLVDAEYLIRDVFPAWGPVVGAETEVLNEGGFQAFDLSQEVFVSYAWTDESRAFVDRVEQAFRQNGLSLIRDRNDTRYKDSIRSFMQRIGRGKCIVVVISKAYLESKSCMFELTEVLDRGDVRDRVFPIVLTDAKFYDAVDRLDYVAHWERQIKKLKSKMKSVGSEYLAGIREEIDLFTKIRNTVANLMDILGDMNTLPPEQHVGSNFDALIHAVEARLACDSV